MTSSSQCAEDKRAKSLQNIDLHDSTLPQESALGLKWNVEGDFFTYSVNLAGKTVDETRITGNHSKPL